MTEATEKQINFAKQLGIKAPENFTKEILRELIDKTKNERDKIKNIEKAQPEIPKEQILPIKQEYHLSIEECRARALESAIESIKLIDPNEKPSILVLANKFLEFILEKK